MRRLLVALVALSAAGLFTATAAEFSAEPVDLDSFTSSVSISVPDTTTTTAPCPPVPLPAQVFVRTVGGVRVLDPAPVEGVPPFDLFSSSPLAFTNAPIETEADGNQFLTWRSGPAPACGWAVNQQFVLTVRTQFTPLLLVGSPRLRARLFACDDLASDSSVSCAGLAQTGPGFAALPPAGNAAVSLSLGTVTGFVPPGDELRLKLIAEPNGFSLLDQPDIRWGYTDNYKSQLNAVATTT